MKAIIAQLQRLNRLHKQITQHKVATENRLGAYARQIVRANSDEEIPMDDLVKQGTALVKAAKAALKAALKAGDMTAEVNVETALFYQFADILLTNVAALQKRKAQIEREIAKLAEELPAYDFVKQICGFGATTFGRIAAEAGDLSNYSNPSKLWKRFGLAVFNGKSQRRSTNADEAILMGFNPQRRAFIYASIGSSAIERQKGKNRYNQIYLERKQYEKDRNPEISDGHARNRGARYATKRLMKDLWIAWNDALGTRPEMPSFVAKAA